MLSARLLVMLVLAGPAFASSALASEAPPHVRGIDVFPAQIHLHGRDDRQQLLVTGQLESGRGRDLTRDVRFDSRDPAIAVVSEAGVVSPVGSGRTEVVVTAGPLTSEVSVEVTDGEVELPLHFVNHIAPLLSRRGCNGGGCHGKSTGQGGFRLSLFGFLPRFDYESITRGGRHRLVFPAGPEQSLLLRKPTMTIPHGGGHRLALDEPEYERLRRWVAAGMPWGSDDAPRLERLELEPASRILGCDERQQVVATAVYSDGSRRDVTRLVTFDTNDPSLATVDEFGLVSTGHRTGETAIVGRYQGRVAVTNVLVPLERPSVPFLELPAANFIDGHILARLKTLGVAPSPPADDALLLRRATLQIAGRLPTVGEIREFLADETPDKRERLVERLVHGGGHADLFAQKWADILRNKRRDQAARIPATAAFHRWIREAIAENMPYDRFVREIITATGEAPESPTAQWYAEVRSLDRYVDDTAQVFLGLRLGCARCHHHPFESFSQEDYFGLAAFFARVGRKGGTGAAERKSNETIFVEETGEVKHPETGEVMPPRGLGGPVVEIGDEDDPRHALVDWMAAPDNPYFARAFVNRMWAHFFGRGLVEPRDDLRVTNPASNEPLLDALADEFIRSGYDMRHIVRLICTSTTYQLTSDPNADNLDETQAHSRFYPQRLPAEVLLDAIDTATGVATEYEGLPPGTRAVQLPDEGYDHKLLRLYGRPERASACECEREGNANLGQSLFMMDDPLLTGKVFSPEGTAARLAADERDLADRIEELFLTALSRPPTTDELRHALDYLQQDPDPPTAWGDLVWTLINTKEFLFVR